MAISRSPRRKMYRTMQGRMVDIEKLRGANENIQAVGNMKVNARGDILGPSGNIVKPKEVVMKEYYETPKGRAVDTPRIKTPPAKPKTVQQPKPVATKPVATKKVESPKAQPKSGIDAALDGIE
tara:strand:+ start:103 stop:474 length:372 start_codon:yes stop_codon:yes gene_type:complete